MLYSRFKHQIDSLRFALSDIAEIARPSPDESDTTIVQAFEGLYSVVNTLDEIASSLGDSAPGLLDDSGAEIVQESDLVKILGLAFPIIDRLDEKYLYSSYYAVELLSVQTSVLTTYMALYVGLINYSMGSHRTLPPNIRELIAAREFSTDLSGLSMKRLFEIMHNCEAVCIEGLGYYRDLDINEF